MVVCVCVCIIPSTERAAFDVLCCFPPRCQEYLAKDRSVKGPLPAPGFRAKEQDAMVAEISHGHEAATVGEQVG